MKVLVNTCRVIEPVAIRNTKNKAKWRISAEERAQVLNSVVVGTGQRLGDVDVQARSCLVWTLNSRCRSAMGPRATLEKMAAELRQQRHSEWAMDRQVARGMGIDLPREPACKFHTLHRQPSPADDEDGENALLDAAGSTRFFVVQAGATLTLRRLTLRGGRSLLSGGGAVLLLPGGKLEATRWAWRA